jgi:hypothetical protein
MIHPEDEKPVYRALEYPMYVAIIRDAEPVGYINKKNPEEKWDDILHSILRKHCNENERNEKGSTKLS